MPSRPLYEELDYRDTPLGELILRRRTILSLDGLDVIEIILNGEHLMSSLFTKVEIALAHLGLAAAEKAFPEQKLDVIVGGLGLGYTAEAALEHSSVQTLRIIDYLKPVIEWHEQEKVALGAKLNADPRCHYLHGDFFAMALRDGSQFLAEEAQVTGLQHAILLDVDHTPSHHLNESHASLYTEQGLTILSQKIHPGGVFAMWSDDPPNETFMADLSRIFNTVQSHVVDFHNPLRDSTSSGTVYVAQTCNSV